MTKIQGVSVHKTEGYSVFWVSELTEDLKDAIRSRLSAVCHGAANAESGSEMYCYKSTLKEFLKRYSSKSERQKKGILGELLLHILLSTFHEEYDVNSPFFNLEERSVKKGFDIVLNKKGTSDIWIAESKAGELHARKNSTQTIIELINTAQDDLYERLNGDSFSLWQNAIHGARVAISDKRDDRAAIVEILQNHGVSANNEDMSSDTMNVILAGTVFSDISVPVDSERIKDRHLQIKSSTKFKDVYLIAIQKSTYTKIYDFLVGESNL